MVRGFSFLRKIDRSVLSKGPGSKNEYINKEAKKRNKPKKIKVI